MLLRQRLNHNLIPARAQAAFVALLYVFLCTFGMVTHTHAPGDVHAGRPSSNVVAGNGYRSASPAHAQAQTSAKIGKRTLAPPSHCSFCDWQANSQARVVAVWHIAAPLTFAYLHARHSTTLTPVFSILSTSRAPPIA